MSNNQWRENPWREKIEKQSNPGKPTALFILGIVSGFSIAYFLVPIAGFIVGAFFMFYGFIEEGKLGDIEDAANENLIAPFLSKQDLHKFIKTYGEKQACSEIYDALQSNLPISNAANNWYRVQMDKIKTQKSRFPVIPDEQPEIINNGEIGQSLNDSTNQENHQQIENINQDNQDNEENDENHNEENHQQDDEQDDDDNPFFTLDCQQLIILAGTQGSGKTTTLAAIMEEKIKAGCFVVFCDPFPNARTHYGLVVVGRGDSKNRHKEIADAMNWFCDLAEGRLNKAAQDAEYDPMSDVHLCFCVDEFTSLAQYIETETLVKFWSYCLQTLRRLNLSVVIATHNLRKAGLGGDAIAGKTEIVTMQSVQIELQSKRNPKRRKDKSQSPKIPKGVARFKNEGEYDFDDVTIPKDFRPTNIKDLDFRWLTQLDKYPDWRVACGLKKNNQ